MHNVVSFLYYTAGSCIFNDDLDSILYVPLLIVYCVGSGVVSPKLCNFGNLKLRWRLHQSQNTPCIPQGLQSLLRMKPDRRIGRLRLLLACGDDASCFHRGPLRSW